MEQKTTVGQATASLILGILSWLAFGILTAIPAVICGHIAKSKIKKNPEQLQGDGFALAGLIMGYLMIGISLLIIPIVAAIAIPAFSAARSSAMEHSCINNMRIIEMGKQQLVLEENMPEGAGVNGAHLSPYIHCEFTELHCMDQGVYTINPIGTLPECSVHGTAASFED